MPLKVLSNCNSPLKTTSKSGNRKLQTDHSTAFVLLQDRVLESFLFVFIGPDRTDSYLAS